jgi:cell wall-associated NlpC family hydrolase
MPTKTDVYTRAREYVDTPFRHQGRTPSRALDCVGVCACTGKSLGLSIEDTTDYRRSPDWTRFKAEFLKNGTMVGNRLEDAVPGTIVLLREGRWQTHCAVVGELNGEKTIIHAYEPRGKVVEERFDVPYWAGRIVAVFLLNGVD